MSIEENKDIARQVVDAVNRGTLDALDNLVAADYVEHFAFPGQGPGLAGLKAAYALVSAAFPDAVTTVEDWIAEGNKVAARGVVTGTHLGDFAGIAATRRRVSYNAMRIFALDGGKVTEGWFVFDLDGLMRQLTAPAPPSA